MQGGLEGSHIYGTKRKQTENRKGRLREEEEPLYKIYIWFSERWYIMSRKGREKRHIIYYKLSNLKERERKKRRDNNKTLQERERIEEIVSKIMHIKEKES